MKTCTTTYPAALRATPTPTDVQRVAKQYFTKSNRTVAVLVKKGADSTVAAMPVGGVRP